MYIYYNFFIHSSVNGHLGCFHVPVIANSAVMNNGIHVSFSSLVPQGIRLGVEMLCHMVVLFIVFKESPYCLAVQERWLHGTGAAERSYLKSKIRSGGREEIPQVQG